MKFDKINRRRFLLYGLLASPALACADAAWLEPEWVKVRSVNLGVKHPTHRIVHFTDIHHKGDRPYLESVVAKINRLSADVVCFTGDLIEDAKFIPETLEVLKKIRSPLYGVPGNHDYWSDAKFDEIGRAFATTGGAWLMDSQIDASGGKIHITGLTGKHGWPVPLQPKSDGKNILLLHYPLLASRVIQPFDLLLAGHSHGGQIRIPFYGPVMLPFWVGKYDMGLFQVKAGPLYVNPGIGYLFTPIRFNCRPEITVFEI